MVTNSEHTFYAWLIVIGAVCITTFIGAIINRLFLNRRLRLQLRQASETSRSTSISASNAMISRAMTPSRPERNVDEVKKP